MEHLSLHILTPNKNKKRFFGVDYFMNILTGYNPKFKYYATSIDSNSVYEEGPITLHDERYDRLDMELSMKESGSIIGLQNNPDIYDGLDSLSRILSILEKYEMGLYIETTSLKIIDDLDLLAQYAKNHPLLIAIPAAVVDIESELFGETLKIDHAAKIISKCNHFNLNVGLLIKPVIPYVNDQLDQFVVLMDKALHAGAKFIYPSFSLRFDSRKIKDFYDVIDLEFPEYMVKYYDLFGQKTTWESEQASELKKSYVIICRKNKVLYAMKDIINSYKPDLNIQLKLF